MSFALPTITTVVDKHPPYTPDLELVQSSYYTSSGRSNQKLPPTLWQILSKYDSFRELVRIARMEDIFNDPQAKMTIFVPIDLLFPRTTLKACIGEKIEEKEIIAINFELARTMVNSVTLPSVLSTTMMMQSAFTRYRTRDLVNTLTVETPHCVQFEPQTYTRPPFGIVLNGKARVLIPDILASNGMVHTIDKFPYF
jgi:uncharacterized surface protein with fasciclin (FAS1) repeats